MGRLPVAGLLLLSVAPLGAAELRSPDGAIALSVAVNERGEPRYAVAYRGEALVAPSRLGLRFARGVHLDAGLAITGTASASHDDRWEQPWGERRLVSDRHEELLVTFAATEPVARRFAVRFRAFDDGIGFRYEVPVQAAFGGPLTIVDELTEFTLPTDATAWWIPGRGWNRYEYLYRTTSLGEVPLAHTPITLRTKAGVHVSIHEAALLDYAAMVLDQRRPGVFEADLTPWSDGARVRKEGAFVTPWRTIQIAPDAVGLLNSDLILNLNEPNRLGDVSWVEPGKYVGIWWAMHIRERTWGSGPAHGATTAEAKRYIDFAADHGFAGVLVEGWNVGWDGDWFYNGRRFDFTRPHPDFDLAAVAAYARERGVRLIGHHETSGAVTHYERQLDAALDLYAAQGVAQIKTGYVADAGDIERDADGGTHFEWHDGQFMVNHFTRVLEAAAKRRISINTHEPVKATGLRRTYPNALAREGARGQEFNAWGDPPNPPEHTAILPFTRLLGGPMDFTPGIFDLTFQGEASPHRVQTTLAKQLALYVVLYSPIQMAADLPENYLARPDAFQFIKDVATDWEESLAVAGEVGDFVAFARRARGGEDWYLGALTDEAGRTLTIPLAFLAPGRTYRAELYRDATDAHWRTNPHAIVVEATTSTREDVLELALAPGGGVAVRFTPEEADGRP